MTWNEILDRNLRRALMWASVFLIILLSNMVESKRFSDLENSFTSVYENRLVAKGYLFKISGLVQFKESQINTPLGHLPELRHINDSIDQYIVRYEETVLTPEESQHLESLKKNISQLFSMNSHLVNNTVEGQLAVVYQKIYSELNILADIQLSEGKKMIEQSSKTVIESRISTGVEIAFLIGLVIYSFLFKGRS